MLLLAYPLTLGPAPGLNSTDDICTRKRNLYEKQNKKINRTNKIDKEISTVKKSCDCFTLSKTPVLLPTYVIRQQAHKYPFNSHIFHLSYGKVTNFSLTAQ